jgi:iron complex outermembrane receptor protein
MVQNVFTITKYSGVDPEVPNGMDIRFIRAQQPFFGFRPNF